MVVEIIAGDLLEAKEDIIVQQVNCKGVMGSGIALQLKNKYPEMYRSYVEYHKIHRDAGKMLLGDVHIWKSEYDGKIIANMFSQVDYGISGKQYTVYEAMEKGLEYIKTLANALDHTIAIPYGIGCGFGGGDWEIVSGIIHKVFPNNNKGMVKFYKYTL